MANNVPNWLFFNQAALKPPRPTYVAWVDLMGARNAMSQSLASSANHLGRIHAAIIRSKDSDVRTYPVMDGAYVTSEKQASMIAMLKNVFSSCAEYFAATSKPEHRFLIRAGLAFGPVVHGTDITEACNAELANAERYKENLLFGIPMIQANRSEPLAPPFGIHLDESARSFASPGSTPFSGIWLKWWDKDLPTGFLERVREHFDWYEKNWRRIDYKEERVKAHFDMARQYFSLDDHFK